LVDKGTFADDWKIARVCPNSPTSPKDFRPISVLPILSKIYKKVLKQLINHVEVNIYNNTQSGFRKGHSTATLLLKLQDGIKKAMNRGEISLAVS